MHSPPRSLVVRRRVIGLAVCGLLAGCSAAPSTSAAPTSPPGTAAATEMAAANETTASPSGRVHRVFDEVPPIHPSVDGYARGEVVLVAPDGARWELPVLVARTAQERQHGLMEVAEMPDGTGMAFLAETDRSSGFWMSGTFMDIDIVYVDAKGRPVAAMTMVPCPAQESCPVYPPGADYRNTLEVPGGWFDRIGFDLDWTVLFS